MMYDKYEVETMKKTGKILALGVISILLLSGMLVASATINGGEPGGLTPGFWKNLRKHGEHWTCFSPSDTVEGVFDLPNELSSLDVSLIAALKFGGGDGVLGMAQSLLRAAVAAILNDAHPDIEYQYTGSIIEDVNNALASLDRDTMETLKDTLDEANNYGFSF